MKALVFAAGLGTRLHPYTLEHPKALVPVGGVPILERVIRKLISYGIDELVVNVHHFAAQIVKFLQEKDFFGITIHISDESSLLLDTGGGILAARRWLDDGSDFVVHNADILTNFDLSLMIASHLKERRMATLLVAQRSTSRYLLLDQQMWMRGWTNIKSGEVLPAGLRTDSLNRWAFGGVHILSSGIFTYLEEYSAGNQAFPIMPFYIKDCEKMSIRGYAPDAQYEWFDIGKPENLAQAEKSVISFS